ncbi:MAG: DUF6531 domain-containing protein [Acidobacteriota bacterium]
MPADAVEILSGFTLAVRFPESTRQALADIYPSAALDATELELPSVPWDTSPSVDPEPARNPSYGSGEVAPGLLLATGEMTRDAVDLAVAGRGLDVAFARTYRSRSVGSGPLSPGRDLGYRVRLRALPTGDVELRDGRGRVETFELKANGGYRSPIRRTLTG